MNLIEAIKAVPDYRHARGIRHELWLILTIVLLGSCTGYWGYKPLASFTKNHRFDCHKSGVDRSDSIASNLCRDN